jgi:hypothetical protein
VNVQPDDEPIDSIWIGNGGPKNAFFVADKQTLSAPLAASPSHHRLLA